MGPPNSDSDKSDVWASVGKSLINPGTRPSSALGQDHHSDSKSQSSANRSVAGESGISSESWQHVNEYPQDEHSETASTHFRSEVASSYREKAEGASAHSSEYENSARSESTLKQSEGTTRSEATGTSQSEATTPKQHESESDEHASDSRSTPISTTKQQQQIQQAPATETFVPPIKPPSEDSHNNKPPLSQNSKLPPVFQSSQVHSALDIRTDKIERFDEFARESSNLPTTDAEYTPAWVSSPEPGKKRLTPPRPEFVPPLAFGGTPTKDTRLPVIPEGSALPDLRSIPLSIPNRPSARESKKPALRPIPEHDLFRGSSNDTFTTNKSGLSFQPYNVDFGAYEDKPSNVVRDEKFFWPVGQISLRRTSRDVMLSPKFTHSGLGYTLRIKAKFSPIGLACGINVCPGPKDHLAEWPCQMICNLQVMNELEQIIGSETLDTRAHNGDVMLQSPVNGLTGVSIGWPNFVIFDTMEQPVQLLFVLCVGPLLSAPQRQHDTLNDEQWEIVSASNDNDGSSGGSHSSASGTESSDEDSEQ
eukprot:c6819_g1_i2.p1 GENE.c6819_g1_i2~~c6819_g1_i2.p1  ORF type:complete len:628 (+),score=115.68 c6819_g1_i2:282-1886(+)